MNESWKTKVKGLKKIIHSKTSRSKSNNRNTAGEKNNKIIQMNKRLNTHKPVKEYFDYE